MSEHKHHACIWVDSKIQDLGTLDGDFSEACGINRNGTVVGFAMTAKGLLRAIIWEDRKLVDLNDCIPPDSGWTLALACAINSRGQIVGRGEFQRHPRAFLLTPIQDETK